MPKQTKQLSIRKRAENYANRILGGGKGSPLNTIEDRWVYRAFLAGYAAARRDPMVINGITEGARWAECARWCDAIQAVCPNKHPNGKLGTTRDIATFIAAAFNLEQPSLPNMTANDS